ncbi:MAG: hypothetical protein IAA73_07265 [Bacteroidetes bacterium]|uniref:Uncharacterized protein n=1 Tax=Candidatus Gallipaludibacter merdavium TaxID=2840839 RepID=A0A9D9N4K3_9BACT|nr:hypothetical protein [Candidatus Gallipaludibacter merdavium]
MEEILSQFIIDNFGLSVFIMVVIVIGIIFVSIWCYKVYAKVKKIDELPCDRHKDKMYEHDNAVTRIETSINFLTKEIDTAMKTFQHMNVKTDSFTKTNSPLSITEKGWEMVHRLGVDTMFEKNWPRINKLISEGVDTSSAYDINNFCIEQAVVFPEKFLSDEEISHLKEDAYQTGNALASYMKVIAVMSRDRFFEENGMNANDIDAKDKE